MPSRVIREGLLDSPRYLGAKLEARDFFIKLLLVADDFGCLSLAPVFIGRRCFNVRPGEAKLNRLYTELVRVDLIRIYDSGGSVGPPDRYAFIPRFRQTLRQMKARHPMPPPDLYEDDYDAAGKFREHKELFAKMPRSRTTDALHLRRRCSAEEKGSDLESISVSKPNDSEVPLPLVAGAGPSAVAPERPAGDPDRQPQTALSKGSAAAPSTPSIEQWAREKGLKQRAAETKVQFRERKAAAYSEALAAAAKRAK